MTESHSDSSVTRREFLKKSGGLALVGVPLFGTILAACGSDEPAAEPSTDEPSTDEPAADEPAADEGEVQADQKTLVLAMSALTASLDREFEIGAGSLEAMVNVYEPLTKWSRAPFRDTLSFNPVFDTDQYDLNILESVSVADDGVTWTLKLKPGTMSHSGNEAVAEDYIYALARHAGLWALGSFYNFVASLLPRERVAWTKVDDYTVEVVTQEPSPVYLSLLENNLAEGLFDSVEALNHTTADDEWSTEWMKTDGDKAGHGPYVIEEHIPGQQTVFKAFADYHGGKPAIDTVIHRQVDSSSTRASLLRSGDVDIARDLLPTEFEDLQGADGVVVDNFDIARSLLLFLMLNNAVPPFDNQLVRQALAHAAPYPEIVNDVYRGFASEWRGILSQDYPFYDASVWPYGDGNNLDRARELLTEAGFPDGFSAPMMYNSAEPETEQVAIVLQTAFRRIGVEFELEKFAAAAFTERLTGLDYTTAVWKDLALSPDIGYACYLYYRSTAFVNVMQYVSQEADDMIDVLLTTLDPGIRGQVASEFQSLMLSDCPCLFLTQPHWVIARRENIAGVTNYTARALRFDDLDIV